MSLDVGAIAKGYTAERIAEALSDAGFTSITLNLGGNVRVIGEKPNGEGWTTGVENPHVQGGEYIHKTTLTDGSAVTSGDYQRYYEVDGVRYHHIIDKDTLMPAVSKLTDVRLVNNSLKTMLENARREYYMMVIMVVANIPILYCINQDWYNALMHTTVGKIVLAICAVVIFVTALLMSKITKPVEYRR
jgi:hypothetical protein